MFIAAERTFRPDRLNFARVFPMFRIETIHAEYAAFGKFVFGEARGAAGVPRLARGMMLNNAANQAAGALRCRA